MALDAVKDRSLNRVAFKTKMLESEEELRLAYAWRDERCEESLHRLITAYMRLAISMASKFGRYGAPMNDLVQEASLGLMKAADKFDPDRGVRFSTYAVWWIRAGIQDRVMRDWSLVRTGTTSEQKTLFFNLRRVQGNIEAVAASAGTDLDQQTLHKKIASVLGVSVRDVEMMVGRLTGPDASLNAPVSSTEDEGQNWIDWLEQESPEGAETAVQSHDTNQLRVWIDDALDELPERERVIVKRRKFTDNPDTLEVLGLELGLTKERVRQLEVAGLSKLHKQLSKNPEVLNFLKDC